jgi:ZIP family zinc transporter
VAEAFAWGFIAASSLLLGALIALRRPIALRPLGLIMAFGSGVLISSVAYELVEDAFSTSSGSGAVGLGLLAGALTFYLGDLTIDRFGGDGRKSAAGGQDAGSALAILFGTVLAGYALFDEASAATVAFVQSFAGGALLTMLTDTMMPEAFKYGGKQAGLFTTLGFALAFLITTIE